MPFDYDRRHTLNIVANMRLGARWELGLTGHYGSGFPYDPPTGVTVSTVIDSLGFIVPEYNADHHLLYQPGFDILKTQGSARLPAFAELDARLTYAPHWFGRPWSVYVDVINVTKRRNVVEVRPVLYYDPTHVRPRLASDPSHNFPLLPTLGITVRW